MAGLESLIVLERGLVTAAGNPPRKRLETSGKVCAGARWIWEIENPIREVARNWAFENFSSREIGNSERCRLREENQLEIGGF